MLRSGMRFAALGLVLCFAMAFAAEDARAASADQEIGSKKGVSESLGNKEFDQDKLPGKLEIGIALGSVAALIGVVKYL